MSWEEETIGWISIKEGETKILTVQKIIKKEATSTIQPLSGKNYYYEFETDLGTLTVNNFGLFTALVQSGVREKDKIKIEYIKKGALGRPSAFNVTILSKGSQDNDFTKPQASGTPDEQETKAIDMAVYLKEADSVEELERRGKAIRDNLQDLPANLQERLRREYQTKLDSFTA